MLVEPLSKMELLLVRFFATNVFHKTEARHVKDYEDEDNLFECPPNQNHVGAYDPA